MTKYTAPTSGAAIREIEDCPELNLSNYGSDDVDRLNDWAIRADEEIDRLRALAAGQATAAQAVVPTGLLHNVIALCTQRGYSPENIEAWSTDDKWIADLWRQAAQMLAAAPTQPAAQQAAPKAAPEAPILAIETLMNQAMEQAVANGANSVSMPDEIVEVAYWLAYRTSPIPPAEQTAITSESGTPPAAQQPHGAAYAALPDGWVPLMLTHEGQYPEEVAYGPQIMMDRLGKWLGKYFAQATQADSVRVPTGGGTSKNLLQVQAWVIPDGNGGGQFSWQKQDGRFWTRLTTPAQAAQPDSVQEDAERYRLLRRGQHWSVIDAIGDDLLRAEALDAAIDAAIKQGASQ